MLAAGDLERARAVHGEQHLVLVLQGGVQDLDVLHRVVDHQDAAVDGHVGQAHASSLSSNLPPALPPLEAQRRHRVRQRRHGRRQARKGGAQRLELRHGLHVVIL
jgi:hypothetical protein